MYPVTLLDVLRLNSWKSHLTFTSDSLFPELAGPYANGIKNQWLSEWIGPEA